MSRSAPLTVSPDPADIGPSGTRPLRVDRRTVECDDVVALDLVDPQGAPLPAWAPGAHVDVVLNAATVRQYSLCGDPADRGRWRLGVLREAGGRGGSVALHDEIGVGSVLEVGDPRNNFALPDAPAHLLLGGGIGITPLLPMARELHRRGTPVRLLHATRSAARSPFAAEVTALGGEHHHDDVDGLLDVAGLLAGLAPGTAVSCCGPEGLLAAAEAARPDHVTLHVERFAPKAVVTDADADGPFEVLLRSTGAVVQVAEGQSVLDAVSRAGADVPSSCREGTCASCETGVVDGLVDHRDSILTDEERAAGTSMFLCVSRARSPRLVLDL
ncbi:PDR/VanB family oxidoreductase [Actinomycetospora sp. NBRC 106378]|uniref:PDR/VanB family oxidoreductase n=1 Tax=Actinomycetospora sp. NBRC 106378 TaxID=3032208 RepID=UPI0024A01E23|nr:PDR/VanB family oxidoreductase [Actinomycetospora sp. NBRC 106378]GLZ52177.1 ferredoxin [Actinomycetospora sp. NBRC 106378]